jgi:hypothetical protein
MFSDRIHQLIVKPYIMVTHQASGKRFAGIEEMPYVCPGEILTRITGASLIEGVLVCCITAALDDDFAARSESHACPAVAGRQDTIEEIYPVAHGFDYVLGVTTTHEIARFFFRYDGIHLSGHLVGQ